MKLNWWMSKYHCSVPEGLPTSIFDFQPQIARSSWDFRGCSPLHWTSFSGWRAWGGPGAFSSSCSSRLAEFDEAFCEGRAQSADLSGPDQNLRKLRSRNTIINTPLFTYPVDPPQPGDSFAWRGQSWAYFCNKPAICSTRPNKSQYWRDTSEIVILSS